MRTARITGVVLLVAALLFVPTGAALSAVLLTGPMADDSLGELRSGYSYWLTGQLESAGLAPTQAASPVDGDVAPLLAQARGEQISYVIVPDMRMSEGMVRVGLRLFASDAGEIVASAKALVPMEMIGDGCQETLFELLTKIGISVDRLGTGAPPRLDELAAAGRALAAIEREELRSAWREVDGKLTPTARRVREVILARAEHESISLAERARVLAAAGAEKQAWALISDAVARQTGAPQPDREILLAAVEVELSRNRIREARAHLTRLLELEPDDPDVQLARGELLIIQRKPVEAQAAFAEAARLDESQTSSLHRLKELQDGDPPALARTLLQAAEREADRWNLNKVERLSRKAARLSPVLAPAAHTVRARAHERAGQPPEALSAWREALEAGGDDAEVWAGIGRSESTLGEPGAEPSYRKALALEPLNQTALAGLGQIVLDQGRPEEALPLLRSAVEVAPASPTSRVALAKALSATGDPQAALEILQAAPANAPADAEMLKMTSVILRRAGESDSALDHMEWAARLDPHNIGLQQELAAQYEAAGRPDAAARARRLAGQPQGGEAARGERNAAEDGSARPSLDGLVLAFANQLNGSRRRTVAHLGIRESQTWQGLARQWLDPRAPDLPSFEAALQQALSGHFDLVTPKLPDSPVYQEYVDRLYGFEQRQSADATSIATLNDELGTDAFFVANIVVGGPVPENAPEIPGACDAPGRLELQVRMLSGAISDEVSILYDRECFAGGLTAYGVWNRRVIVSYAALLLFLVFPVLRGWGTLVVDIKLPPRTKGFLHIKIGTSPEPVTSEQQDKKADGRIRQVLNSISRYRKQMAGSRTVFRWIPARRREYYVSVKGPLLDATTKEIIGHFIEEQRFRAARGKSVQLTYDMVPSECAVQVDVMWQGAPARAGRVALRDRPDSLRYARGGSVFYYLGVGSYTVGVGALDRAREYTFEITSLEKPVPVVIDLAEDHGLQVRNCAEAVEPFLMGDFGTTATLLDAAGESELAHAMRAAHHRQRGDTAAAAAEYQSAGRVEEAAEMLASSSDHGASAGLLESTGDHDGAAEAYRAAGDLEEAARCYVAAYDYDNAIECYEAVGDLESVISLHEKTGAYLDAAVLAKQYGNNERALQNLQEVERRDPSYGEACRMTAEILADRGKFDLAAERLGQTIELAGGDMADVELHARRAELLDMSGDADGALEAFETVRRLDPTRDTVEERIETLRAETQRTQMVDAPLVSPPVMGTTTGGAPAESRYEILGELGRGGMGVVYKARDTRLNRIVALKQLPDNLRDNRVAAQLFLREAQAAASLNHRNIVTVYDAGEENGVYHITMELLEGLPLSAIQERRGTLGVGDTAGLGLQVCAGLDYAHTQRIVHRDIKTANLFFTRDRVVKIMDFGLAKTIEEVRKNSTVIGGTPYYMAPEQAAGEPVDNRTDLYAFGITLYRLLTGTFPFTEGSVEYHHRHTPPPDPREHVAEISEDMARLILDLLEKDPELRPATAADVATRLQTIRQEATAGA